MNLSKQNKDDLIDLVNNKNRQIAKLKEAIDTKNEELKYAEMSLQRALGYIDLVNEGKDNPLFLQAEQHYIKRGPNLEDIPSNIPARSPY